MATEATEAVQTFDIARAAMLRIARVWQSTGNRNQAIDLYSQLMERYPDSAEAREAADELLAFGEAYERQQRYRLALDLYQKLEGQTQEKAKLERRKLERGS